MTLRDLGAAQRAWIFAECQRQRAPARPRRCPAGPPGGRAPCPRPARRRSPRPRPAAPGRPPASPRACDRRLAAQPLPHSSAVYGATSDSMTATVSAASRTAGSAAPGPESMALRVALTSSIIRATTTLNRCASTSLVDLVDRAVGDPAQRRRRRPPGRRPGAEVTSAASRQARGQELQRAAGRHVGPVDVVLGRAGEHHRQPDRVHAVLGDLLAQVDAVAQRLAHRLALVDHLALVQQPA